MLQPLRTLGRLSRTRSAASADAAPGPRFVPLRLLAAELFLAAGAGTTLHYLQGRYAAGRHAPLGARDREADDAAGPPRMPLAVALAPALLGPLAAAAQTLHALRPAETTETLGRVLSGTVLALGLAGLADSLVAAARGDERLSLAPLLFGSAGALGLLLDREETRVAAAARALERRARIVERVVPRRRPKLERIVVHV